MQRFGEVFKQEKAFPEVEKRLTVEELLNREIIVYDVRKYYSNKFDRDFVIILASFPIEQEEKFTFVTGSEVVMRKTLEAKERKLLPLSGQLKRVVGKNGNKYLDIE